MAPFLIQTFVNLDPFYARPCYGLRLFYVISQRLFRVNVCNELTFGEKQTFKSKVDIRPIPSLLLRVKARLTHSDFYFSQNSSCLLALGKKDFLGLLFRKTRRGILFGPKLKFHRMKCKLCLNLSDLRSPHFRLQIDSISSQSDPV